MNSSFQPIEDEVFAEIERAVQIIAARIDHFESLDDFQLVDLYAEIEDLNTRSSFSAVVSQVPAGHVGRKLRRYDELTKHHPTNAYARFRAIADRMDDKWTAVNAILKDRKQRGEAGARGKMAKNPTAKAQGLARQQIKTEWGKWQAGLVRYENEEDFGRKMHGRHSGAYKSERSIANLARRWLAESA